MAERPKLNEAGEWRYETVHHMGRRCFNWDYTARCIYEITVVLKDRRRPWLGELKRRGLESGGENAPSQDNAAAVGGRENTPQRNGGPAVGANSGRGGVREWYVEPTADGLAVVESLLEMPKRYPQVSILEWQLMPEHLHFIVFVREPLKKPLGALVRGFKAGAVTRWKGLRENAQTQHPRENAQTQHLREVELPEWGEGFVDVILWRDGQLQKMFDYLRDNPRRLAVKRADPELFRRVCDLRVSLRENAQTQNQRENAQTQNQRENAQTQNQRENAQTQHPCENAQTQQWGDASSRSREEWVGHFAALGNRFLLQRPLAQVQVSRGDFGYQREPKPGGGLKICRDAAGEPVVDFATPAYDEKKAALLAAAKHGAVLISPCVSDGERQIAREALAAKLPLVTLQNKGFSKLEKPSGRYFDACADGRLLMLAPAAWPYQPGEKPMTRVDATAMNRLCQWIVGDGAAEINYHGMKPGNIDALAIAAAKVEKRVDGPCSI